MELNEVLKKRVSTREFSIETVSKKEIEELINAARIAPSAGNRQPWHFVIVENDYKKKVAEILLKKYKDEQNVGEEVATKEYIPAKSLINSIRVISEAPILILIFRINNENWHDGDYLSIGCAGEHIALKATDLGLGTLWIRDVIYMKKEISKLFHKEDMELVTGIAVGYSTEYPYERKKKCLKDIMEWYK